MKYALHCYDFIFICIFRLTWYSRKSISSTSQTNISGTLTSVSGVSVTITNRPRKRKGKETGREIKKLGKFLIITRGTMADKGQPAIRERNSQ